MNISSNLEKVNINNLISRIPLFASMDDHEQNLVIGTCAQISYGAEEIVIDEGQVGDRIYAILQGQVLVSKKTVSAGWKKLAILSQGDFFGEIAIMRSIKRTARVSTISPCTFLTINATDFLGIYEFFSKKTIDDIQLIIEKRLAQIRYL